MTWTAERVESLRQLWSEGFSAGQISERLGVTRGSVCGKLARLGLQRPPPPPRVASRRRRPKPAESEPLPIDPRPRDGKPLPPLPLQEPAAGDVARIATVDLEPWHCRWPIGDPLEIGPHEPLFCGAEKSPGIAYCQVHAARAFGVPATSRVPAAAPAPAAPAPELETAQ